MLHTATVSGRTITTTTATPLFPFNGLLSRTTGKTSLDVNEARDDGVWDAVASAGPHANNLHLAPDR